MSKKIKIENDLYEKLARCAEAGGYSGTDEFIVHALEKAVRDLEAGEDEETIKERLKGLGYLG